MKKNLIIIGFCALVLVLLVVVMQGVNREQKIDDSVDDTEKIAPYFEEDLVGRWQQSMQPSGAARGGFILYEDGVAESVDTEGILYQSWGLSGGALILRGQNTTNDISGIEEFAYGIVSLSESELVLDTESGREVYVRGENTEPVAALDPVIEAHILEKSDLIRVSSPQPLDELTNPIQVSGEARGTWFFEASFPIVVVDWNGRIIGEGYATADGEWMTESFVPFTGTIEYLLPNDTPYARGAIIFRKDNPSGLPERDDALEFPVMFAL